MLPQSNAIDRPTDLDENHIYIEGGEDGSFNSNYLILFYVKSPEKTLYNRATDSYEVIKNHHSESVHYYITLKNNNGLRIQQSPMSITQSPPIDWYREVILHELNEINLLRSGREWLGERFTNNTAQSFQFSANELRRDQSIKFQIKAAAQSFNSSTLNIELNNSNIGQIDFESIPNTQYGIKANLQEQIFTLDANSVSGNELVIELGYNQNSQNNAIAYLDKLTLDIPKNLALEENLSCLEILK